MNRNPQHHNAPPTPDSPAPGVTMPDVAQAGQKALAQAEAQISAEWNVGDVILDLYEVTGVLGEGGMGKVYKVRHRGWKVDLAVKSPKPEIFVKAGGKENFVREAETWVNLGLHPNTVSCYYVRTLGGIPRVFAEFVEGGSLSDWIRERKLTTLDKMLDVAIQFAWGLHYAHEQGLVHQDVKPANVMMSSDGLAKVTDFGLARARAVAGDVGVAGSGQSILVSKGGMTPAYCSPEQGAGKLLSRKTDIWSWGVSVLEMFVGEVRWLAGQVAGEALAEYLEPGATDATIPAMPVGLAELLKHCFQINPADRPADMSEIVAALQQIYQREIGQPYSREAPKAAELRADGLNNKALSLLDLGREEEANAVWQEALRTDPRHLESTFNYGYWRWHRAEIPDDVLVTQLQELESDNESDPDYWRYLGWIHLKRGDTEAVERIQQSAHRIKDEGFKKALADKDRSMGRLFRTLHTGSVDSLCFSSDGRFVLSGGDNGVNLWEVASGKVLTRFEGHTLVTSVCFSPDSRYALSGSRRRTIILWEVSGGKELRRFEGHTHSVESVCFSPDGRYALSGSADETVRLWEVASGGEVRRFDGHKAEVRSVCFSPDGRYALSGGVGGSAILWEVASGRELRRFREHHDIVQALCFSPDGRYALTGESGYARHGDCRVRLWEVASGSELRRFVRHTERVTSVCFSPDGRYALSGSDDDTARLWELTSGKELGRLQGHTGNVHSVCFSPDGRYALCGGDRGTVIWEIDLQGKDWEMIAPYPRLCRPKDVARLNVERDEVTGLLRSARECVERSSFPEAYRLLRQAQSVPGYQRDREVMDLLTFYGVEGRGRRTGSRDTWLLRTFAGHTGDVTSVCFSPDGRYALSGSEDETIRLWEAVSGRELKQFQGHTSSVTSVCFSPDGRYALSSGDDRTIRLWDVASGREVRQFQGHTDRVKSICFSPDGRYALSGGYDRTIRLWDVASGREIRRFREHNLWVSSVCFSPDGRYAASGSGGNLDMYLKRTNEIFRLWEVAGGRALKRFDRPSGGCVRSVCFSPDGRYALSGDNDGAIWLWETASGKNRQFQGRTDSVYSVCFSPDGRYALSGGEENSARLWEVANGREVRRLMGHTRTINSVCFSPDGRYALSGSSDGTIKLWESDWEWEFPVEADWDEGARPYLEVFLALHPPRRGLFHRASTLPCTGDDFQKLLTELGYRGYGWLRSEGVRRELEKMALEWKGPPPLVGAQEKQS